jgi:hypothetical protein
VSLAHWLVGLIPTRRVSEGRAILQNPSLTRRVGMFPLPAANLLEQQAVTLRVGINPLSNVKSIMATNRHVSGCDVSSNPSFEL